MLEPLLDPRVRDAVRVGELRAVPNAAAVCFDLFAGDECLHVEVAAKDETRRVYFRSPSFDVLCQRDVVGEPSRAVRLALELLRRAVDVRDVGAYRLEAPAGRLELPVLGDREAGRVAIDHVWDRGRFDARIEAALRDRPGAVVVGIVTYPCEMQCVFCPSSDRDKTNAGWAALRDDQQLADLTYQFERAAALGARRAGIGGNDAVRFPLAPELLQAVLDLGYDDVFMHTTGLPLADRAVAERLAGFSRLELLVPIYGATAELHDAVTNTPGAFDRLCRALENVRALGGPKVRLQTIALAATLHHVEALAAFVRERFDLPLFVDVLRGNRVGERDHLAGAARLDDVRALARRCPALEMPSFPRCVLAPEQLARPMPRPSTSFTAPVNLWELGLERAEAPDLLRDLLPAYGEACETCAQRSDCPGATAPYLDRFGDRELSPLPPGT